MSKNIVSVKAREPGPEVKTLADWAAWRVAENKWMEEEVARQFAAFMDAFVASMDAMAERDRSDTSQH